MIVRAASALFSLHFVLHRRISGLNMNTISESNIHLLEAGDLIVLTISTDKVTIDVYYIVTNTTLRPSDKGVTPTFCCYLLDTNGRECPAAKSFLMTSKSGNQVARSSSLVKHERFKP